MRAQESQTGQPSQPTSSVYNRMRRIPAAGQNESQNGPQQQARRFPNPAQQFPPEQRVGPMPGQVPNFGKPPAPQPVNQPQNGASYPGMVPGTNTQPSQQQAATVPTSQGPPQP